MMAQIREKITKSSKNNQGKKHRVVRRNESSKMKKNEADDWIKTCDLIKEIHIDNPNDIIEKVYRKGNISGGFRN